MPQENSRHLTLYDTESVNKIQILVSLVLTPIINHVSIEIMNVV